MSFASFLRGAAALLLLAGPAVAQEGAELSSAAPGETVLLPALRGISLARRPNAGGATGISDQGAQIPDLDLLRLRLRPALNAPASLQSLNRITPRVRNHMTDQGYPFTLVSLPEQDITDGTVTILVRPSRLEQPVRVEGAKHFPAQSYRAAIRPQPDGRIYAPALEADVARVNANPFRRAEVVAAPGRASETTRLTLKVKDQHPWQARVGTTWRTTSGGTTPSVSAGLTYGNIFGIGDLLSYDLSLDPRRLSSANHALQMTHFMRGGRKITAQLTYSAPKTTLAGGFTQAQRKAGLDLRLHGEKAGARAGVTTRWYVGGQLGTERSDLRFGALPVSQTHLHTAQMVAGVHRSQPLGKGRLEAGLDLVLSPGNLSGRNTDAAFNAAQTGARSRYAILRGDLALTYPISDTLTWRSEAHGQVASGTLIGSQAFSMFSSKALRVGSGSLSGGSGLSLRNTLDWGPYDLASGISVTPGLFADLAVLRTSPATPGRRTRRGLAAGAQLSVDLGPKTQAHMMAGLALWDGATSRQSAREISIGLTHRF